MIVKGKDVIGLNVVTIDNGTKIETVDDIAYDPTTHQIVALLVDSGGLFSSAKVILMDDVHNIGEDAVIVPNANVIKTLKELADGVRSISESNRHLVTTNILTIDGKQLGRITDIYFDSKDGHVESMEVSQGGLKTMTEGKKSIKPSDIVTIGADATIVSAYTEQKFEDQGEEGGLKGAFNDTKDRVEEVADNTRKALKDAGQTATEKTDDFRRDIGEKTDDLKDKTDDVVADLRRNTKNGVNRLQDKTDEAVEKTRRTIDDAVDTTKDKVKDFKDGQEARNRNSDNHSGSTDHHPSDKVVEQAAKRVEDAKEIVEEKRTVIRK